MRTHFNSLETIEKIGNVRMRSIYRAQKLAGENFLPLISLSAKASTFDVLENEVVGVS